jgi:hypothetical protein
MASPLVPASNNYKVTDWVVDLLLCDSSLASGNQSGFSSEISATISSTGVGGSGCDLNGDGGHNALDLQSEVNAILAGSNSTSFDINRDSAVNALDLQVLGNVVLGVRSCP